MSQPIYTKPNFNNKVKILINGKKVSEHPAMSKHARYINFISERTTPVIKENEETDSFDIDLEKYVYDIIAKYMEDKKPTPPPSSKKIKKDKLNDKSSCITPLEYRENDRSYTGDPDSPRRHYWD